MDWNIFCKAKSAGVLNERPPEPLIPDILAPGLDLIVVGAAPSLHAARTGHYYAGPRNRFWSLLHLSGFTPCQLHETEDHLVLGYGIGLTAVFKTIISTSNDLLPQPSAEDRHSIAGKLKLYAPRVVCYNGRDVYRMCHGEDPPRWGLLRETIGTSLQFVVHSSSGRADRWGADRLFLWRELKGVVDGLRQTSP